MHFEEGKTYHIYNRSNSTVFYNDRNYLFFISKIEKLITPVADILAWCLMPNHFHFLIVANENSCESINEAHRPNVQLLSKNIGSLLSGYTKAINKQRQRRGKLFSHNTQAKCLNNSANSQYYIESCFHYIHQNPMRAGICNSLKGWKYSSYIAYTCSAKNEIINKDLAFEMINYDKENFEAQSNAIIEEKFLKGIW